MSLQNIYQEMKEQFGAPDFTWEHWNAEDVEFNNWVRQFTGHLLHTMRLNMISTTLRNMSMSEEMAKRICDYFLRVEGLEFCEYTLNNDDSSIVREIFGSLPGTIDIVMSLHDITGLMVVSRD